MAATSNSKVFLKVKKRHQQPDKGQHHYSCSVCGKKLKKFVRRTSHYSLACWQCMIVNHNNGDSSYQTTSNESNNVKYILIISIIWLIYLDSSSLSCADNR